MNGNSTLSRKAAALAIITWLPLLILSAIEGTAFAGSRIPFAHDIASHVRCLIAIPVLVLAEIPVRRRIDEIIAYIFDSGIVADSDRARFLDLVEDVRHIINSWWTRGGLLILSYASIYTAHSVARLANGQIWFEPAMGESYSYAGLYYNLVTLSVFNFLMYRWAFRILIATRCLWKISRLHLRLTPTHPDEVGGLGGFGKCIVPLGYVAFALSSVISGGIASRVLFADAKVEQFGFAYLSLLLLSLLFVSIPLFVFVPRLLRLKQSGLLAFGVLASHYTRKFDQKWIGENGSKNEELLGSADIQSLADLGGGFEIVHDMRLVPIELKDFLAIVLLGLIPALPLAALVMPIGEILKGILRLLV